MATTTTDISPHALASARDRELSAMATISRRAGVERLDRRDLAIDLLLAAGVPYADAASAPVLPVVHSKQWLVCGMTLLAFAPAATALLLSLPARSRQRAAILAGPVPAEVISQLASADVVVAHAVEGVFRFVANAAALAPRDAELLYPGSFRARVDELVASLGGGGRRPALVADIAAEIGLPIGCILPHVRAERTLLGEYYVPSDGGRQ